MREQTQKMLDALASVRWFGEVGRPVTDRQVIVVSSCEDALAEHSDESWSDVLMRASNEMRHQILANAPQRLEEWNEVARSLRTVADRVTREKVTEAIGNSPVYPTILDLASWDVLGGLIEQEFGDVIEFGLYTTLLQWYRAGHFPCDWKGHYPDGQLVVY